ncbi:hypothetical protein SteCoe_18858 [Stentor coeruleus]|uniref:Uncharacterized protein n=1 Tax=Stentor coeruleus TaxID=5963 RepID=A0A1R2BVL0_9CILI|nr:hypothetical protein SteCoe_18858 [Stentor coeruleus]
MKNWIKRKTQNITSEETATPSKNFTAMNSNSLYSHPVNELVSIIFRFDTEVKNLVKELNLAKDTLSSYKDDLPKAQEQSLLYKQHNEALQIECNRLAKDLNETTTTLCSKNGQIDLLKNQLFSKDELIQSYKAKIQDLEKQVLELQMTGINFQPGDEVSQLKMKLESLQKTNLDLQKQIPVFKYEMESIRTKMQDELFITQERAKDELERAKESHDSQILILKAKICELETFKQSYETLKQELETLQTQKNSQDEKLNNTLSELHQKTIKISTLESEIQNLNNTLIETNNKNDLTNTEILKLSQKLEVINTQKSSQNFTSEIKIKPLSNPLPKEIDIKPLSNPLPKEIDILTYTKNELDNLYKSLMKIINPSNSLAYLIKIEDFTTFEKNMNNIVMQVHEQLDEISEEKSWAAKARSPQIGKSKGRTPVKLFSCMADQDDAPRLIPKPLRPVQQVDSCTVLRRGSAN